MKRLLVSAAVLGLFSATAAQASPSSTTSVPATADIFTAISIAPAVESSAMYFGQLASPTGNTDVIVHVDANGVLTSSPALEIPVGSTGNPARFTVTGSNLAYHADLSGSSTALTMTGGQDMALALAIVGGGSGRAIAGGSDSLVVTGDLTVHPGQASGTYSGEVHVTVAYD